jgi:hypothetical protein
MAIVWTNNAVTGVSATQGGFCFRTILSGLTTGNLGQVRITLSASFIILKLNHCSIGVVGIATPPNCTNIQTFLFSSSPAVLITSPTGLLTLTSDWLTVPAFTSADSLIIDQDCDPSGTGDMNTGGVVGGGVGNAADEFYSAAGANNQTTNFGDYNQINVAGYTSNPAINRSIVSIETQSGGATVTLMGAISL